MFRENRRQEKKKEARQAAGMAGRYGRCWRLAPMQCFPSPRPRQSGLPMHGPTLPRYLTFFLFAVCAAAFCRASFFTRLFFSFHDIYSLACTGRFKAVQLVRHAVAPLSVEARLHVVWWKPAGAVACL